MLTIYLIVQSQYNCYMTTCISNKWIVIMSEKSFSLIIPDSLYEKYKDMHENFLGAASKTTLETGSHIPMFIIKQGSNLHFMPAHFSDNEEKIQLVRMCKVLAFALEADAVFFISESWISRNENSNLKVMPSEDPQRIEALFVSLWIKDIGGRLIMSEMKRDSRGDLTKIEPLAADKGVDSIGGLFINLCGEDLNQSIRDKISSKKEALHLLGEWKGMSGVNITPYKKNYKRVLH